MDHNPYRPPDAVVTDRAPQPKPPQVRQACRILWAMMVLGLISLHPSIRGEWWAAPSGVEAADVPGAAGIALAIALTLGIALTLFFAGLVVLVGRRHNWARWTLLVYLVLGWVVLALELPTSVMETPLAATIDLLSAAAEAWACYLPDATQTGAGLRGSGGRVVSRLSPCTRLRT